MGEGAGLSVALACGRCAGGSGGRVTGLALLWPVVGAPVAAVDVCTGLARGASGKKTRRGNLVEYRKIKIVENTCCKSKAIC